MDLDAHQYRTKLYQEAQERKRNAIIDLVLILILLISFGFPGKYKLLIGNSMGMMLEYAAFIMEIALMLFSDTSNVMDVKLINIKGKYRGIYLLMAVYSVCSIYIVRDRRTEIIISCVRLTTTALFAIWMSENLSVKKILELTYWTEMIFMVASVFFMFAFPRLYYQDRGSSYMNDYVGLFNVKNEVASHLSFALLMQGLLLWIYKREGKTYRDIPFFLPFLGIQIVLMLKSHGLGSLFFAGISLTYLFLYGKVPMFSEKKRLRMGYIYIGTSIGFLLFAMTIIPLFAPVFEALGKDATLTGRTQLWPQIIRVMMANNTFTGFGYGMFWRNTAAVDLIHAGFDEYSFFGNMKSGAHNSILEIWLNTGLLGVSAHFFMLLDAFRNLNRLPEDRYIVGTCYVMWYMLCGLMERSSGTYEYTQLYLYLAVALICNKKEPEIGRLRRYYKKSFSLDDEDS